MTLLVPDRLFAYEMERLLRLFYPAAELTVAERGDPEAPDTVSVRAERAEDGRWRLSVRMDGRERRDDLDPEASEDDAELALGRVLYRMLCEKEGRTLPWGIMTGVRPVRVCRAVAERTGDEASARRVMAERYLISPEKLDLLTDIARVQKGLLTRAAPDGFSLYVSIPFCPSRCLYCSFVSHDIAGMAKLAPEYVRLLCEEIRVTGELAARQGLRLQTVYIGGGTPTTLEPAQLEAVMTAIADSFDRSGLLEYTVEAGRPDTVTAAKLETLRRMGADRVSINPQTMDDGILRAIGRNHTAAQIEAAMALARTAGFENINMDLIAGLPGETGAAFAHTLDRVLALAPENVTVHTLTVKRSSRLRNAAAPLEAADTPALLETARERLGSAGYRPYYLYRQKGSRIAGAPQNLENTGYALPGREGLYNALIMEEVQTILAAGAGAVTKLYAPGEKLERIFNYKFPFEYIDGFDEILRRKAETERRIGGGT